MVPHGAPLDPADSRRDVLAAQLAVAGIHDDAVIRAVAAVPRELFVDAGLAEFALEDAPLPGPGGTEVASPLVVAALAQAAEVRASDRVLEVGAGSGFGAAVLAQLGAAVWAVESHPVVAQEARQIVGELGLTNVQVVVGDPAAGCADGAPFDVIVLGGSRVEPTHELVEQLAVGGRMLVLIGVAERDQRLVRVRRNPDGLTSEDLGTVRRMSGGADRSDESTISVPPLHPGIVVNPPGHGRVHGLAELVRECAEPFDSIEHADVGPLLERIGECSIVLIGEASHGTSEFYRMRDRITRALIARRGFTVVAVEADWPDAARIDRAVRGRRNVGAEIEAFARFPTWMWRNREVANFVEWLRAHNRSLDDDSRQVSFCGLDLYSLFTSRAEVLSYLDRVDPDAASVARHRYGCLTPWQADPAAYGRAVVTGRFAGCEAGVVATLSDLLRRRLDYAAESDGGEYLDAAQNAVVVANAERYYRIMYQGSRASWNLRDQHMFETLQTVRAARGPGTKVVVWEHNSHVGDASATEMGARGEHNVGMLTRREYGSDAYLIGFGTDRGSVAAATEWGGPLEYKAIRPAHVDSYERVFHESTLGACLLHLREPRREELRTQLSEPRLERAIGVIYRPETELQSHYFQAVLPGQFDEYVWIDETTAVHPLSGPRSSDLPDTFPFGL